MFYILLVAIGIALLALGGEVLIRGALAAAKRFNVSPLLTGLLIVGFGTSAPELVVSIGAAVDAQPDVAIGNVVGSNIGNILLILGICALITPLTVKPAALRRDAVSVIAASVLFVLIAHDGVLGKVDAAVFLTAFFVYLAWAYWAERFHEAPSADVHKAEGEEISVRPRSGTWILLAVVLGLLLLIGGARALLVGAVEISRYFGVSEAVIGLTVVAVGTSLPELTVSLVAALRRHADVAVGNILGSNIFNVLGILGVSSLLQPLSVHRRVLWFDQWFMLGSALLLFVFLSSGRRLSRLEGGVLLACYGVYLFFSFTVFKG